MGLVPLSEPWVGGDWRGGGAENLRPARAEEVGDDEEMRGCELRTLGANLECVVVVWCECVGVLSVWSVDVFPCVGVGGGVTVSSQESTYIICDLSK